MSTRQYFTNVLIGTSQALNTLLGGDPDHTLSGRMGRALKHNRCKACGYICELLDVFFNEKNHCQKAIEHDEGKDKAWRL